MKIEMTSAQVQNALVAVMQAQVLQEKLTSDFARSPEGKLYYSRELRGLKELELIFREALGITVKAAPVNSGDNRLLPTA